MRLTNAVLASLMVLATTGCSTVRESPPAAVSDVATQCEDLFRTLDAAVDSAGVRDGGVARIEGFPYLRTNRFLASYRDEPMNAAAQAWWVDRMRALDTQARTIELANLPKAYREVLQTRRLNSKDPSIDLMRCGQALVRRDLSDPDGSARLRAAVDVPDEYQTWKRVLGLYPFSALAFLQGVSAYHADTQAVFATALDALPMTGRLWRYGPPRAPMQTPPVFRMMLARARDNPLGVPIPTQTDLMTLVATHAPLFEVDQVDRNDQIGMPTVDGDGKTGVDVANPTVFFRFSLARYEGEPLLQLVYSVWFPGRPRTGPLDLLGGQLDGITWRVTLDRDGKPLLYDSMHNCGCYHMFFPTDRLRPRARRTGLEEPVLIGSQMGPWTVGERIVLRIAARTHYLQNVRYDVGSGLGADQVYRFTPDDQLRTLPGEGDARHSLFRPDGIVPGTERGERYLFWPMGIPEPGAMRQWGRHATAFVGRRHFDDPDLLERYFERL